MIEDKNNFLISFTTQYKVATVLINQAWERYLDTIEYEFPSKDAYISSWTLRDSSILINWAELHEPYTGMTEMDIRYVMDE